MKLIKLICMSLLVSTQICPFGADELHQYMWANYKQFSGDTKQADQWYKKIIENENPIFAYKGYIHFLRDAGQMDKVAALIPKLDSVFKDDPELQFIFAQAEARVGENQKAEDRIIKLSQQFSTNQEIVFHAAQVYLQRKEAENAILVIDNLLNSSPRKPNNFIFHFLKSQIYTQLDKKEQALKSIQDSLELYPKFDKAWLMYAILQEQQGKLENAIKGYTTFLEISPESNKKIEQHIMQLTLQQKMSLKQNTTVILNKSCFERALLLFEQKNYPQALQQVEQCIKEQPGEKTILLKVQILSSMYKHDQAVNVLKKQIDNEPNNDLWFRALHLLCSTGLSHHRVIKALLEIKKKQPENLLPSLYLADLYMRTNEMNKALSQFKQAVSRTPDKLLKTKILFQMGVVYYERRDFRNMKKVLEHAQQLNITFAPLLNLLAFYYISKENDIQRAQALMKEVLKIDNKNPHYLDTQALIFYKKKQYTKAHKMLLKLAQAVPDDFMILKHLAKTCHKIGDRDQACNAIKKAHIVATTDMQKQKAAELLRSWL